MYQNIFVTRRTDFEPALVYVWDDEREDPIIIPYDEFNYAYKPDPRGTYTSMYGHKLRRYDRPGYNTPGLFESDVPREMRVLTDLYLDSDTPSKGHRILIFDIEVESVGGFAKPEIADKPITAISAYLSTTGRYTCFILDPDQRITSRIDGDVEYVSCIDEDTLLRRWMKFYKQANPTILSGWNISGDGQRPGYDIPYVYNRLKRLYGAEMAKMLSPIGIVTYNTHRNQYQIAGVSILDYFALYRKYTYSQQASYRLDYIGKVEVGMGKIEYSGTLDMLYKNDLETFLKYNLHDVRIVKAIDDKMKLIELVRFICHLGHVPYEDCLYSSKFIEGTILTYLHRKGIIASNKPEGGREEFDNRLQNNDEGFTGAYVRAPMPGLYRWVYSLDLQSLYPSIIMSLNISPDTKIGKITNFDMDKHIKGEIEHYVVAMDGDKAAVGKQDLVNWLRQNQYSMSSNGILYRNDKIGVIPEILDKWFAERVEFKGLMKKYVKEGNTELADFYDRRQHVQKILLNSIYGVLGLPIFRFYDVDNALAVTASGQDVIKTSAKYINVQYRERGVAPKTKEWLDRYKEVTEGFEVEPDDHCIYIDTDSLYFSSLPLRDISQSTDDEKTFTIKIAREMETLLNRFYRTLAKMLFNCDTHRFFIKGESVMKTGFWLGKKTYTMQKVYDLETDKDMDKVATKGIAVVRSDTPPGFRNIMKDILADILHDQPKSVVDQKIVDFKKMMKTMPPLELAKNTAVKDITSHVKGLKTTMPAHVKASMRYNDMLKKFGLENIHQPIRDGDKIKWTYLTKNPYGLDTIAFKTYDDPPQIEKLIERYMDRDALFEAVMEKKVQEFYNAMDWGQIPTKVNQRAKAIFTFE